LKDENCLLKLVSMTDQTRTDSAGVPDKEFVLDLLRRLPDDVSIYEIAQELEFIAAVRQGLDELDNGRSVSIEQIERDLASWSVTMGRKPRGRHKRKAGDSSKSPASSPGT
jgi:hypothetical protein